MQIRTKYIVFHIGINELNSQPIDFILRDFRNVVLFTSETMDIPEENILVTSVSVKYFD